MVCPNTQYLPHPLYIYLCPKGRLPFLPLHPFFSANTLPAEPGKTLPFNIRPSEAPATPLISNILWTKAELRAIVRDFPKVTEGPHKFAEEFNSVIQT